MPRYFFHYRTDDQLIEDREGREFDNLAAAEHNAAELGRAIVDRAAGSGEDPRLPRSIEITDASGEDLLYVVFCVTRGGWGWNNFLAEADTGEGLRFPRWARGWLTFGLPALILVIFVMGYLPKVTLWLGLS